MNEPVVVDLPIGLVAPHTQSIDLARYDFPMLVRYHSYHEVLPAITIEARPSKSGVSYEVVAGAIWLEVARALGRDVARAVLTGSTSSHVLVLLGEPGVTQVDLERLRRSELKRTSIPAWEVFRFERPLTEAERADLESTAGMFLSGWLSRNGMEASEPLREVKYSAAFTIVEILAVQPSQGDRAELIRFIKDFVRRAAALVSHNGVLWRFG